ncbi:MAG: formate dehydrogenase accessory sulfurtransferase FdhD [Arenicellales bacterium]|nr:formate dehydrogenase accessory sulfurtransferase FdhD [Arenicellales bacterium]MDP6723720.1 formate dehydrogenase accessory sulfurtransferase FdhD [Arenicellales bacterium]
MNKRFMSAVPRSGDNTAPPLATTVAIVGCRDSQTTSRDDLVAIEEPLEINVLLNPESGAREADPSFTLSITMRSPGEDRALATGFLFTEGIIHSLEDLNEIRTPNPAVGKYQLKNTIQCSLNPNISFDYKRFQRYFYTNSSCGVCGKTSINALSLIHKPQLTPDHPKIGSKLMRSLPQCLASDQPHYQQTGGLHGAALFSPDGTLISLQEDIGRHNAVDKVIGSELLAGRASFDNLILLLSGRAGFELIQKALAADIPVVASIGAPTSLAIDMAKEHGMTLIGFLSGSGFNIYSGRERIED